MNGRLVPTLRRTLLSGILGAGLTCLASSGAWAWGSQADAGTSGAAWLLEPSSARLLAMGGAGTGQDCGVSAWWWNPAAPAAYPAVTAELAVRRHFADSELGFAAAAIPTSLGTASLGAVLVQVPGIAGYDDAGAPTQTFAVRDLACKLGWAYAWPGLICGVSGTYLQEDFYLSRGTGWGLDLGVLAEALPGIRLGGALLRLGRTSQGDPLPAEVRFGGSARVLPQVQVAFDLAAPRDAEPYLAAGGEWRPAEPAALRLGLRTGPAASWQLGTLAFLSAGAGVEWSGFALDYAFEPGGALGDAHHLTLTYRGVTAVAVPEPPPPAPEPQPAPRLQVLPRAYEGQMVITPRAALRELKAKTIQFRVRDAEGRIVRTFAYAGQQALPKELVWDGKDDQGRLVDQDKSYSFDFEYMTPQGVRTEALSWPQVLPARKLWFQEGGRGIAPEAWFRSEGARERVTAWHLTVLDEASRLPVREFAGTGPLPEVLEWDGRDTAGAWAPPDARYVYQLELQDADASRVVIEHPVVAVPAQEISRGGGRVRFKIFQILFDFARATIRAEMADKIEKAAEIGSHGGVILSIQGHADEVGTRRANEIISRRRAETVYALLGKHGLSNYERIAVQGFGNSLPVVTGGTEETRSQNRRVVIVLNVAAPELDPSRDGPGAKPAAPGPADKR